MLCQEMAAVIAPAVQETLEEMAFVQMEACEPHEVLSGGDTLFEVRLPVERPLTGYFALHVSSPLLREVAGNIYACGPEELSLEQVQDTLAEILNTVAGRVLEKVTPHNETFELGIPCLTDGAAQHDILREAAALSSLRTEEEQYVTIAFIRKD